MCVLTLTLRTNRTVQKSIFIFKHQKAKSGLEKTIVSDYVTHASYHEVLVICMKLCNHVFFSVKTALRHCCHCNVSVWIHRYDTDLGLGFLLEVIIVHIVSYCLLNIHLIIVDDTITDSRVRFT